MYLNYVHVGKHSNIFNRNRINLKKKDSETIIYQEAGKSQSRQCVGQGVEVGSAFFSFVWPVRVHCSVESVKE